MWCVIRETYRTLINIFVWSIFNETKQLRHSSIHLRRHPTSPSMCHKRSRKMKLLRRPRLLAPYRQAGISSSGSADIKSSETFLFLLICFFIFHFFLLLLPLFVCFCPVLWLIFCVFDARCSNHWVLDRIISDWYWCDGCLVCLTSATH